MTRSLLFVLILFAIALLPDAPLLAQQPGQTPSDQSCGYPIYKGKQIDRKLKILDKPEPRFSGKERREYAGHTVLLTALFCGSGEIVQIEIKTGVSNSVEAKAVEAAKKIRFIPAQKDGQKVSQMLTLEYPVQHN
jgi:hypothetical protein